MNTKPSLMMNDMTHWRVTIKEWNTPHEIVSDNISHMSREQIIEFYGLNNPDVEYYSIEAVKDKEGQTQERAILRQESRESRKA